MVIVTLVEPIQLVPLPPAVQVWTPLDKLVRASEPAVPPLPIVVCPPKCGKEAIPLLGVTADGVTSPIVTDSVLLKADPAFVTVVSVCIIAGTPFVKVPTFIPPIFPDVVVSPTVTDGVILFPLKEYVVPTLFVTTYGISTVIWADVTNSCFMSASNEPQGINKSKANSFFI